MKLASIHIYPLKSARPVDLVASEVMPRGLPGDRRWMLVDEAGRFITARQVPRLAMVEALLEGDVLRLRAPGMTELAIPVQPASPDHLMVTVWKDSVNAVVPSEAANAWFSEWLDKPVRLVQMTDDIHRHVDPDYGRPGDEVSFADGFPLLLITTASLEDLNRRLAQPVPMQRFRPNLVIDGAEPYAEDTWPRLRIGEVEFEGVKNCSRCVFTTIDPETGTKSADGEPLKTLGTYRLGDGGIYFGQNLIPRSSGTLRVGDTVEILERNPALARIG